MKNKKQIVIFSILFFGFICGTIGLTSQNDQSAKNEAQSEILHQPSKDFDSDAIKTSGSWVMNNITIDDTAPYIADSITWAQAITTSWCSGEGTWNNPYIIENVTIDATTSPTGSGILIQDSDKPFIIRNCTVYNAGNVITEDAGIKLVYTNNGTIINNNCSNNMRNGIILRDDCENNTISTNIANDNNVSGIYLYNCSDNVVFNNSFSVIAGGQNYGLQAYYSNENIISNNTVNGNYKAGLDINSDCNDNIVANNTLNSNGNTDYGISLVNCLNTELSGNEMKNCGIVLDGFYPQDVISHTIFTNNTVNGKPVYYYADESDLGTANFTHTGEPGQIILAKCRDSIISSFNLSYSSVGIELTFSDNITVSNNTVNYNRLYGIYLNRECNNNTIFNNTVNGGGISDYGVYLYRFCFNNNITKNTIYNNTDGDGYGLYLDYKADYTNITDNTIKFNNEGIIVGLSTDFNIIKNNTVNDNDLIGIYLRYGSSNNAVVNNTVCNTGAGSTQGRGIIIQENCHNNTVIDNEISNNSLIGLYLRDNCDDNKIKNNTLNDNGQFGIYLYDNCDYNTIRGNNLSNTGANTQNTGLKLENNCDENDIIDNTLTANGVHGILLETDCDNNLILNNTLNDNGQFGIYLYDNCDSNDIIKNTGIDTLSVNRLDDGIRLENDCDENTIEGNYFQENEWNGIRLLTDCDYNRIFNNILYNNTLSGIFLDNNCENNQISGNSATFNDEAGIYLNVSNSNRIYSNTAKNNTYGLRLNASSYNCIYGNILVNNTYNYNQSGTCVGNGDCRQVGGFVIADGDDGDDDDDDIGAVVVLIIVIIIVSVAAGVGIIYVLIQKGIIKKKSSVISLKGEETAEEKKIVHPKPAEFSKKDKKPKKGIPPVRVLTEAEKKKEIEKTEAEIDVEKKQFICIVHRGAITGTLYVCPSCQTIYCEKCAKVLKEKEEKCWSCNQEIEL